MRGGGVKGRLELFQKFIHFGNVRHPLPTLFILINICIRWQKLHKRHSPKGWGSANGKIPNMCYFGAVFLDTQVSLAPTHVSKSVSP